MIKVILVICVLVNFMISFLKRYLNRRERSKGLPDDLKEIYRQSEFDKWDKYMNKTDHFSLVVHLIDLGIALILILSPIISIISDYFGDDVLISSLALMAIVIVASHILSFIEDYYETFVIEQDFGMNNTTMKVFVSDALKDFALDIVLILAAITGVHYLYVFFSYYSLILIFIIFIVIMLVIQRNSLAIMKLYNKFTPLEDNELKEKLTDLVEKYGFELEDVYVMDASKRTKRANAFCMDNGKKKVIAIDDNMFEYYSTDEIIAVFAHELGHAYYNHSRKMQIYNYLQMLIIFVLFMIVFINPGWYSSFGFNGMNYYMVIFILIYGLPPLMFFMEIPYNYYSRKCEDEADSFAKKEGYGDDLARILKDLTKKDLSDVLPHPLVVKCCYSHPTLTQRLDHLKNDKE